MKTNQKPASFGSLVDFGDNLAKAESVKVSSKNITLTTKDHEIKKIARTQLDALAIELARNTNYSSEEKLKYFENTKLKLRELSHKPNEQEEERVISDLEGIEEFIKKNKQIEEALKSEASKIGDWFPEVTGVGFEKFSPTHIEKIHAHLLKSVPLSGSLDAETWYKIVNKEVETAFRIIKPYSLEEGEMYTFLSYVGDLNLERADPLEMTTFDADFQRELPNHNSSLYYFIAPYSYALYECGAHSKADLARSIYIAQFASIIMTSMEMIHSKFNNTNLISSLENQLIVCRSLIPEKIGNVPFEKASPDLKRRYHPYTKRCKENEAALKMLREYKAYVNKEEGGFNRFKALAEIAEENNARPHISFSQNRVAIDAETRGTAKIRKISKKHQGLCELICNKIVIDKKLGDNQFDLYIRTQMDLQTLDQPQYVDTHTVEVASALDLTKAVLLDKLPESLLTSKEQKNICHEISTPEGKKIVINDPVFEGVLEKMELNQPIKIFTYRFFDFRARRLVNGHSLLMMKTSSDPDLYTLFDPNYGRYTRLTKEKLKEYIERPLQEFGLKTVAFVDAEKLMEKNKPKKKIQ